ncbi:MAG: transcription/translation regulatory transformer protein RfaH [Gammaproteobacteria bacterium]|jgi:transcriptional antiterminator RfaH
MRAWYLIYTKPSQEDIALDNLERQDYEAYLPKILGLRKKGGRSVKAPAPMFPRYLFIHLDNQEDDWGPIRSTIGVQKLVRFGVEAARIPNTLIEHIRKRENEDGLVCLPDKEYKQGDKVRINSGPFEGYEAIFSEKQSKDRVIVMLGIAEKHIAINLDQFEIETA